jgi:regulator of ribosome biosynthesis
MTEVGPIALLPAEIFRLPRAKKIPEAKAETKWEKFAKEKGIKKTKKERMIFDEETQQYRPRWGYKSAKGGIEDQGYIEIKPGDDPFADPFAVSRANKKAKVQKNLQQQLQNKNRAAGIKKGGKTKEFG